jgi:hypothetical protein
MKARRENPWQGSYASKVKKSREGRQEQCMGSALGLRTCSGHHAYIGLGVREREEGVIGL